MCIYRYLVFFILSIIYTLVQAQYGDLVSNELYAQAPRLVRPNSGDQYLLQDKLRLLPGYQQVLQQQYRQTALQQFQPQEKVRIQLFYECLCPDCKLFDSTQLAPTVKKLSRHLDVHLYPYGNARTIIHADGKFEFQCQHGPAECYGNKLHACAIDLLGNITEAVEFNSCMMQQSNRGSNDAAADTCGLMMNIASSPIKLCAKSSRGSSLLKYYGDESQKVGFKYVPYILINGVVYSGNSFMRDVCAAFKNPPPECYN